MNEKQLTEIIDGLNDNFKPLTDENLLQETKEYGIFERTFKNINTGKFYIFKWTVIFGTPETVEVKFNPPMVIG